MSFIHKNKYIIVVDDDPLVLVSLNIQLKEIINDAYLIETVESAEEAIEIVHDILKDSENCIPLIISDYQMGAMNGSEMLIHLDKYLTGTKKILLTGQADFVGIKMIIENLELFRYMQKPWDKHDMFLTVKDALDLFEKELELKAKTLELEQLNKNLEEKVKIRTLEVYEKNKEIEANLDNAQIIQSNLLDSANRFKKILNEIHIMYRPLHKVSGDFYVMDFNSDKSKVFIAVGDCVGHGVGGAFLTMFFLYAIRDLIKLENESKDLNTLFIEIENRIISSGFLGTGLESFATSDLTLMRIDLASKDIEYASNNHNLIVYDDKNKELYKPYENLNTKHSVTNEYSKDILHGNFNAKNKYIAMFSDGIIDQFGGDRFKKLKRKNLYQWITDGKVFLDGECKIDSLFDQYKNKENQIDDCVWLSFKL